MKKNHLYLIAIGAIFSTLLSACAFKSQESAVLYDLGPLTYATSMQEQPPIPPDMPRIVIASILAPSWLDSNMMYYRLAYSNTQQTRYYTRARWNMPPANLIRDRLQSSIASAGGTVMEMRNIRSQDIILRIELEDFSQHFESASQSVGRVAWRASLFQNQTLLAQQRFWYLTPAPSADAAGGARALAEASDKLIGEVIIWMINTQGQRRG